MPDIKVDASTVPPNGPIRLGSEEHKNLFCRTLLTTFDPYKPAVIDWPELAPDTRDKITSLPIWDIAVQTEGKAGLRVATYGKFVQDAMLKRAIALNAYEESRHKHVLHNMVQAYGIRLAPEPAYLVPRDADYRHTTEGPDDMPAHIRAALTQNQLSIPVDAGRMLLGTWQGIYLFEHRSAAHRREIVLTLIGE